MSGFTAKFGTFYGVILWSIRVDHRKLPSIFFFFLQKHGKVRAELAVTFAKARALHLTSFLLSLLL